LARFRIEDSWYITITAMICPWIGTPMDFAIPMVVRTADRPEDMVGMALPLPPPWQPDLASNLGAVRVGVTGLAAGAVGVAGLAAVGVAAAGAGAVGGGGADPSAEGPVSTSPPSNAAARITGTPLRRRITGGA
jgi:hypothetical protein